MFVIMKKARNGDKDAMLSLYNANKEHVMFICTLLTEDMNTVNSIITRVFRKMWDLVTDGEVKSEQDFSRIASIKAINYCRICISRNDSKAFRTPANKSFVISTHTLNNPCYSDVLPLFIAWNLSPLQRFICILKSLLGYSEKDLARIFKITEDTVRSALNSEESNINRLQLLYAKSNGREYSMSVNDFHKALADLEQTVNIPENVNAAILLGIDSVCDPIIKERNERLKKTVIYCTSGVLCLILVIFIVFYMCSSKDKTDHTSNETEITDTNEYLTEDISNEITYTTEYTATHYADINIEGYGIITVALDGNKAPITVENFVKLAKEGFYDGLTFHRIVEGFVMQGGDPDADGMGGNTDENGNEINITGEFTANGSDNDLSHIRGAISMARGDGYDSASSQFFIVHTSDYTDSLDGLYAVFGYVTEGLDIVDEICEATYTTDEYEVIASDEQPHITSITVRDVDDSGTYTNETESGEVSTTTE